MFLANQIQKEHSIEDLHNFLIVLLISLLLKHSFLKQHKTDLEQYTLAPSIAPLAFTSKIFFRGMLIHLEFR